MYSKPTKGKIFLVILFNLLMIALLLYILEYLGIFKVSDYYSSIFGESKKEQIAKIEDPNLLDREQIRIEKASIERREMLLKAKDEALKRSQQIRSEQIQQIKQKLDELAEKEKKLKQDEENMNSRKERIKKNARSLANMPPKESVAIIEGLDTLDIIEIFDQMDKDAEEQGKGTVTDYYLSLLASTDTLKGGRNNPKKAQEVIRLRGKYKIAKEELEAEVVK